mgnify:CR=1 FL=1
MNSSFWKNRNVFLTGHSGFKGGWTALWLSNMGANVYGYSLQPSTKPSFFEATKLDKQISKSTFANILDLKNLVQAMKIAKPSVVIHMAAQSLVRESYKLPVDTYMNNVIGTVNVLEASRQIETIKAIINVTTDKCYENQERTKPYSENDRLGGHDPYSSSKACSELVTTSYRKSFLSDLNIYLASVRSGNVIGGGDWANDRLIPDFFKALNKNETLRIRSPNAIRPWQHVLEPISGYLMLAEKLITEGNKYSEAWNFGPEENETKKVSQIAEYLCSKIKGSRFEIENSLQPHEAQLLKLDSSKAKTKLAWKNQWNLEITLNKTIEWYQAWRNQEDMKDISISQINCYEEQMEKVRIRNK